MDDKRVAHLLELLRQRTREEITLGVMALGPSFTPEMRRALELLCMERSSRSCAKSKIIDLGSGGSATGVRVTHRKPETVR
jgi:hypothetical protein